MIHGINEYDYNRVFAIGDIHGNSELLKKLLDEIKPTKDDLCIFLGDYINRGPDSKGVIDILLNLKDNTNTRFIMGNHDEMLLAALAGGADNIKFFKKFGQATIDSYNLNFEIRNFPRQHALFFADLLDYCESDRHIFVHASVEPDKPMILQCSTFLRWTTISTMTLGHGGFRHESGKTIICGHEAYNHVVKYDHAICIDTGCVVKENGGLTAFNVKAGIPVTVF